MKFSLVSRSSDQGRRRLLKVMGASLMTATFLPACSEQKPAPVAAHAPGIVGADGRRVLPWQNWSGNQLCQPTIRNTPRSEEQLVSLVKNTKQSIRCVGSGHSFSPLVPTEQTLISLARLSGVKAIDQEKKQVTLGAGTRLSKIGEPLWDAGLGMNNMPDIDTQSLAGAIATSTHGTGLKFGSLSTDVVALRLINGMGEAVECSADTNAEVFHAARNHLGALGVVSEVTLQLRDRFKLKEEKWVMPSSDAYAIAETLRDDSRHFEMYAFPHADYMLMITINETNDTIPVAQTASSDSELLELKKWTERLPWIRSFILNSALSDVVGVTEQRIDRSYSVFGNLRNVLFNEMEYSVPAEQGLQCLEEILATIKRKNLDVIFPLEFRFVKADDVWLSPFYQRDSATISCHNFADRDYKTYFAELEPIFLKYGGRPHWGKIHTLTADDFAQKYRNWNAFKRVRAELDPAGRYLNPHIKELFTV